VRPLFSITAAAAFAIALAACSNSDEGEEPAPEEEVNVPAEEAPAEEPADAEPAAEAPAEEEPAAEEAPAEEPVIEEVPAGAPPGEEGGVGALAPEEPVAVADEALENTLYMELACGRVEIDMRPDLAPLHVAQIKTLTREGFYDGLTFHRVIDGFMAQTGDPTGTGMGGSNLANIPAEFSNAPYERGTVGMARTNDPNSANSQFFIMFDRWASLDGQYTVWGEVADGMDCVDQITRGEPPANPDAILTMNVAADVQ
jgi:peptidylprolyl isomerase